MKRIVIVGATSGIGLEVAKLCIQAGWQIGAAGRREEALEKLRTQAPDLIVTESLDITRDDAPEHLSRLIDKLGGMDIYLHCSGIGKRNTELHPDIEIDTLRTNGEGFVRMVTEAGIWPSSVRSQAPKDSAAHRPTRRPNACRTPTSTHWRSWRIWRS